MLFSDTYQTISAPSQGVYKEKGSKFLAFAEPVLTDEAAKAVLEKCKKQYYDARHHCFAWAIGPARESQRMNDDGEPSGTAGRPIFGQILSYDVANVIVIVVRYFGGTKLGVSGLITAYKTAAKDALGSASIITKTINELYQAEFAYSSTNEVMRVIKEFQVEVVESIFTEKCQMVVSVRKNDAERFKKQFALMNNFNIRYLRTI